VTFWVGVRGGGGGGGGMECSIVRLG